MVGRGGDDPVRDAQPLLDQALGQKRRGPEGSPDMPSGQL